jgi:hypothetical protein
MQRLLTDAAQGHLYPVTPTARTGWDPASVRPQLEHYLGMDLAQIERAYRAYLQEILRESES